MKSDKLYSGFADYFGNFGFINNSGFLDYCGFSADFDG